MGKSESWRGSGRGEGSRCGASGRAVRASPEACRFSVGVLKGEGKGVPRLQSLIDVQPGGGVQKKVVTTLRILLGEREIGSDRDQWRSEPGRRIRGSLNDSAARF